MNTPRSFSTSTSALITVAMNWSNRLIGLVSIAILARLLVPDDFGVIAMAALVIGLADAMLDLGVHVPLIQNQNATKAHYDSAWTLRICQSALSTAVLFTLAPYAAEYFNDPRTELVLQILAFQPLLGGLENIGVVDFQKRMQFAAEFRLRIIRRLGGFLVIVVLAITLRSYWALVAGMLVEAVLGVFLSYGMHPMRPRISFSKMRELFKISQWMLLLGIGQYLRLRLHSILVGRWAATEVLGAYSLAHEIASMPTTELLAPVNRALFARFAQEQYSDTKLKDLYLMALGIQAMIAIPAAVGLALVAEEAVLVLLGSNWLQAAPFIQVLSLIGVAQALSTSGLYVVLSRGKTHINALYSWALVILFCLLVLSPWTDKTAPGVAQSLLIVALAGLVIQFGLVKRTLRELRILDIAAVSWRTIVACAAMSVALLTLELHFQFPLPILALLTKVLLGLGLYCFSVYALWVISGKPSGPESFVLQKASQWLGR